MKTKIKLKIEIHYKNSLNQRSHIQLQIYETLLLHQEIVQSAKELCISIKQLSALIVCVITPRQRN